MNYLTATHAVSLFPRATFVRREMVVCQDLNQHARVAESWMRKWSGRGFTILTAADRIPVSLELRAWRRTIGDHHTWVLPYASKDRGEYLSSSYSTSLRCLMVPLYSCSDREAHTSGRL